MLRFSYQTPDGHVTFFKARIPYHPSYQYEMNSPVHSVSLNNNSVSVPTLIRKHTRFGFRGAKTTTLETVQPIPVSRHGWLPHTVSETPYRECDNECRHRLGNALQGV